MKTERLDGQVDATRTEAKSALFSYGEGFYNRARLHGALGFQSPVGFEHHLNQNTNDPALRLVLETGARSAEEVAREQMGVERHVTAKPKVPKPSRHRLKKGALRPSGSAGGSSAPSLGLASVDSSPKRTKRPSKRRSVALGCHDATARAAAGRLTPQILSALDLNVTGASKESGEKIVQWRFGKEGNDQ